MTQTNKKNRILSFLLSLIMLFSMIALPASASGDWQSVQVMVGWDDGTGMQYVYAYPVDQSAQCFWARIPEEALYLSLDITATDPEHDYTFIWEAGEYGVTDAGDSMDSEPVVLSAMDASYTVVDVYYLYLSTTSDKPAGEGNIVIHEPDEPEEEPDEEPDEPDPVPTEVIYVAPVIVPTEVPEEEPEPTEEVYAAPETVPTEIPEEEPEPTEVIYVAPVIVPTEVPQEEPAPTDAPVATEIPVPVGEAIYRWGLTNTNQLNFRTEPSKESDKAAKNVDAGMLIFVLTETINDYGESWYQIVYQDAYCYVMSRYVDVMAKELSDSYGPAPEFVYVPTEAPATPVPTETPIPPAVPTAVPNSAVITVVYVDAETGAELSPSQHYQISTDGDFLVHAQPDSLPERYALNGETPVILTIRDGQPNANPIIFSYSYVPEPTVEPTAEPTPVPTEAPTAVPTDTPEPTPTATPYESPVPAGEMINRWGITTSGKLYYRDAPGGKQLGQIPNRGTHVYMIREEYDDTDTLWTLVEYNEQLAYIKSQYVQQLNSFDSDAYSAQVGANPVEYTEEDLFTAEPTEEAPIYIIAATPVPVVEEPTPEPTEQPTAVPTPEATPVETEVPVGEMINRWGVTTSGKLYYRDAPGGKQLGQIPSKGTHVYMIREDYDESDTLWTLAEYEGQFCYIKSQYLRQLNSHDSDLYSASIGFDPTGYTEEDLYTAAPTAEPTPVPTEEPTVEPAPATTPEIYLIVATPVPEEETTAVPTEETTAVPTEEPTPEPTEAPTPVPTDTPEPTPTATPVETTVPVGEMINRWGVTTSGKLNYRKNPSGAQIGQITNKGTHVYMIREEYDETDTLWTLVQYKDTLCYIKSQYLQPMNSYDSAAYDATLSSPAPFFAEDDLYTAAPDTTEEPTAEPTVVITETPTIPPTAEPTAEPTIVIMQVTAVPVPELTEVPTAEPTVEIFVIESTAVPVAEYYGYALINRTVAIRDGISHDDSSIITTLTPATLVSVVGQTVTDSGEIWRYVSTLDNLYGYVPADSMDEISDSVADGYIHAWIAENATEAPTDTPAPAEENEPYQVVGYAYTIADNIPFRNLYSDRSVILAMLDHNTPVFVAGQIYDADDNWVWHSVLYKGNWGYIRSDMLRMMSEEETDAYLQSLNTPEATPEATPVPYNGNTLSSYGYVSISDNKGVVIRSTSSTSGAKLGVLKQYALCLVTGSTSIGDYTWYRIEYNGIIGWVRGDYFKQMTLDELSEFMNSDRYTQGLLNNAAGTASPSTTFVTLEEQNVQNWTDDNSPVAVPYATWAPIGTTLPISLETLPPEDILTGTVNTATTMREAASTTSNTRSSLQSGTSVIINGEKPASDGTLWYNVTVVNADGTNGATGYVLAEYVTVNTNLESLATAEPTPEATEEPAETMAPITTAGVDDGGNGSSGFIGWIIAIILVILAGGGIWLYFNVQSNRRKAAQRAAAQRRAQAQQAAAGRANPDARPVARNGENAARPRTGTYSGTTPTPVASQARKPFSAGDTTANPYARPTTNGPLPTSEAKPDTSSDSVTGSDDTQNGARRRRRSDN